MKKSIKIIIALILFLLVAIIMFVSTNDTAKENFNKGFADGYNQTTEFIQN